MTLALIVIAKTPVAGRSKTRLCPPCTPPEAARLAEAALVDTLTAVARTRADRRILVLDGDPGAWLPGGVELIAQRGDGLDERLAAAFDDVRCPALLIGMDTPQVTPELLDGALDTLLAPSSDAVIGGAPDGGYWAIGLRRPDAAVFLDVPMSQADTGARQRARLQALGLRTAELARLRDVDRFGDAVAVAAGMPPASRFAHAVDSLRRDLGAAA